ncbi:MAG: 2-oxo acid dehydrogenase subunit E2 [Chloroflexota bacterium]
MESERPTYALPKGMSQEKPPGFEIHSYPRSRTLVVDAAHVARHKHMIHGLVEFDVTRSRAILREHKERTGESLSFTAFILHCVGAAVGEDRMVHAYRDWRGRLILFDDVDINTIVEVELEDRRFPLAHVVQATNRRSVRDLHEEIRTIKARGSRQYHDRTVNLIRVYSRLPGPVRRLVYRIAALNPHWQKRIGGTVSVTAVGMFGRGGGWGIPIPLYTLNLTLGGISWKPAVIDGQVIPREMLDVTLSFDHDIVDAAPAARFGSRLKELVEAGYGLVEV